MVIGENFLYETPREVQKILANKGYGPIKQAIYNTAACVYYAGYGVEEVQETLLNGFGNMDPKIEKMIEGALLTVKKAAAK